MSADNYYLIRKHPSGGYIAVMGFASDENTPEVDPAQGSFATVQEAIDSVALEYAEYGIRIHGEISEAERRQVADEYRGGSAESLGPVISKQFVDRDAIIDALDALGPYTIWEDEEEFENTGFDGKKISERDRTWWAKMLGHPVKAHRLQDGRTMLRCETCGVGASCEFDCYTDALIFSVLRQLDRLGVLRPLPASSTVSTGTVEEPADG